MKKLLYLIVSTLICTEVFAIEAKVVSVSGKVQVLKGSAWFDVKPGDLLKKGDLVQTGFKSEAEVSIVSANENSKMKILQLSRITIEQLAENSSGDKTSVYLAAGSVKSEIKKTQDRRANYTVRGPVATASVRGTIVNVKNTFGGVIISADDGIVSAWRTSELLKNPSLSSDSDDKNFEISTSDSMSAKAVSVLSPAGAFTVVKGQSAEFSQIKQMSGADNAVHTATSITTGMVTAQGMERINVMDNEMFATSSGGVSETSSNALQVEIEYN